MSADLRAVEPSPDGDEQLVEVARSELTSLRRVASDEVTAIERQIVAIRQKTLDLQLQRARLIGRLEVLEKLLGSDETS